MEDTKFHVNSWEHKGMTFIEIDGVVYVRVDDIQAILEEIKKTLSKQK